MTTARLRAVVVYTAALFSILILTGTPMTTLLAPDTATEACSVALLHDGKVTSHYEVIPRLHAQKAVTDDQGAAGRGRCRAVGG